MVNIKKNKKILFSTLGVVTAFTFLTFISSNITQAYANQVDAPVEQTTNVSNNNSIQSSTKKPPVSISIYSNVVTESADTYDYNTSTVNNITNDNSNTNNDNDSNNNTINNNNTDIRDASANTTIETGSTGVIAPQTNAQSNVPKTTGDPNIEEPDIITYPPTIAPEYKD